MTNSRSESTRYHVLRYLILTISGNFVYLYQPFFPCWRIVSYFKTVLLKNISKTLKLLLHQFGNGGFIKEVISFLILFT